MKSLIKPIISGALLFVMAHSTCIGQGADTSATTDARTRQLRELNNQFRQLQAANKNSQALEVLQRYGQLNSSRLQDNRTKEINELEKKFNTDSRQRKQQLDEIRSSTAELDTEILGLEASNSSLTTRTAIFFAVLSGFIILILVMRNRVFRQASMRLDTSMSLRTNLEETLKTSSLNDHKRQSQMKEVQQLNAELLKHSGQFEKIAEDKNHSESKVVRQLLADLSQSGRILAPIENDSEDLNAKANLNDLIRDVARLAYEEFCSQNPDFNCELILDLEAILPEVDVRSTPLRKALFCLFLNGLVSLKEKRGDAPKGFQPKLTVTTRKLPRFVQIRIRDNGAGIPAYISPDPESVIITGNELDQQLALGVQEAQRVILQLHKGELVFETEPGTQSDAIIRFQIHSLQ